MQDIPSLHTVSESDVCSQNMKRALVALGRANGILNKHALTQRDISPARLQMLSAIAHFKAPTVSFIARATKSSRQNVSVLVSGLIHDNFVVLVQNPQHKRSRILRLTEEGKKQLQSLGERRDILCESLGQGVSESDILATIRVLNHICKVMEK